MEEADISSGDAFFHHCPDQLNQIEVCMVGSVISFNIHVILLEPVNVITLL